MRPITQQSQSQTKGTLIKFSKCMSWFPRKIKSLKVFCVRLTKITVISRQNPFTKKKTWKQHLFKWIRFPISIIISFIRVIKINFLFTLAQMFTPQKLKSILDLLYFISYNHNGIYKFIVDWKSNTFLSYINPSDPTHTHRRISFSGWISEEMIAPGEVGVIPT